MGGTLVCSFLAQILQTSVVQDGDRPRVALISANIRALGRSGRSGHLGAKPSTSSLQWDLGNGPYPGPQGFVSLPWEPATPTPHPTLRHRPRWTGRPVLATSRVSLPKIATRRGTLTRVRVEVEAGHVFPGWQRAGQTSGSGRTHAVAVHGQAGQQRWRGAVHGPLGPEVSAIHPPRECRGQPPHPAPRASLSGT